MTATITEPGRPYVPSSAAPAVRVTCDAQALSSSLTFVNHLITRRPAVHVLNGVHLTVTAAGIGLWRTDYHTHVSDHVPSLEPTTAGAAAFVLPARALAGMVRAIGRGHDITLDVVEGAGAATISGDGITYRLPLLNPVDFPTWPDQDDTAVATVTGAELSDLCVAASAASRDATLPILTTVVLEEHEGHLAALATDRYRCVLSQVQVPVQPGFQALVPREALIHAEATARRSGQNVAISRTPEAAGEPAITFQAGSRTIRVRTIDGDYPKVRSLFPTSCDTQVRLKAADLARAIERVALVIGRNGPTVLHLAPTGVRVRTASITHLDEVSAFADVPAALDGDVMTLALNAGFALDAIRSVTTPKAGARAATEEELVIGVPSPTRSLLLRNPARPGVQTLLMLIRLADGGNF